MIRFDLYQQLLNETISTQQQLPSTTPVLEQQRKEDSIERTDQLIECRARYILFLQDLVGGLQAPVIPFYHCHPQCVTCYELKTHKCARGCQLYRYKDTWMCYHTGNVHYCTPTTCDYLDNSETHENGCMLTGTIHGVSFDEAKTRQTGWNKTKGGNNGGTTVIACSSGDGDKDGVSVGRSYLNSMNGFAMGETKHKRTVKRKKASTTDLALITSTVKAIVSQAMPGLSSYTGTIIQACHIVWMQVILPSHKYQESPKSYTIPYHCVMVLYALFRDGLVLNAPDCYSVLTPIAINTDLLCSTRKLTEIRIESNKHKHVFTSPTFTRAEDFFQECALDILHQLTTAESLLVTHLRTVILPLLDKKCVFVESKLSSQEYWLQTSDCITVCNEQPLASIRNHLTPEHRKTVRSIHIYVTLHKIVSNTQVVSYTPLYTIQGSFNSLDLISDLVSGTVATKPIKWSRLTHLVSNDDIIPITR